MTVLALNSFLRSCSPSILFLSETGLNERNNRRILSSLNFRHFDFIAANGRSGGIALLWQDNVDLFVLSKSQDLFHCNIGSILNISNWNIMCVYGPPYHPHKYAFWSRTSTLIAFIDVPWCMIGDLNVLMHSSEKHGGSPDTDISCNEFRNFLRDRDVIDLGFVGPAFTWSNNAVQSGLTFERIDRAICNSRWKPLFPDATVLHLPRIQNLICWEKVYCNRVRNLFGMQREKLIVKKKLVDLQATAHLADIREEEKAICQKIASMEMRDMMYWQQRNKSKWVPTIEKNTQILRISVLHRRSKNKIFTLQTDEGDWISDFYKIRENLINHFQKMFSKDTNVVKKMGSLKAPGPDGYPALF
ncbi:uncharacterized protein LOC113348083 [Papaver somniferum]|uniref:uncharacterized protein LOC113348083 n=1 Tax=Papaver somniferum TaxID=3469 RepID=UPI000E6FE1C8|nr:uncharacterized protein LOC113348083 [Papaver somniferum]